MSLDARLVDGADALAALEPAWWDLWRRCPAATPFGSPAWLLPWWEVFRPGRLATVAVEEAGRLMALLPAYLEDGPLGRRLLPVGIGITDMLDCLLDPEAPGAGEALVSAVLALEDWEVWSMEELPPGAAALSLAGPAGLPEELAAQSACPVVDLAPDKVIPSGKHRKLRLAENRIARRSGAIRAVDHDGIPAFLRDLARLHRARWEARGEGGVITDQVLAFHERALPRLAQAGLARPIVAEIDGHVAGAILGMHGGGRAYAYLSGFDPDFAFESPGTALMGHAIAEAKREGAHEFHLLRGQEAYKYGWGATDRWNSRRTIRRSRDGGR